MMFIEQILCRKNPEYIARVARPADTRPLTNVGLFNGSSNTRRDPTLSSSKLENITK